jgi:predicted 3-demethylubiquinone-9 3-methyltransferase (glyoxalase superfamily)
MMSHDGKDPVMDKIATFLWYDTEAEEAAELYVSLFPDSKITSVSRYGDEPPGRKGQVMVVQFQLAGRTFMALNGGPEFPFTEAISLFVNCDTQEEVDTLWERLSEGGEKSRCGWLKDRYGVSWQIVPAVLGELMSDPDPVKAQRVAHAMLQMDKLDIEQLRRAHAGVY